MAASERTYTACLSCGELYADGLCRCGTEQPSPRRAIKLVPARFADDERTIVWVCEKGHVDDHHLSLDGCPERCSRCGGDVEAVSLAALVARNAEADLLSLREERDRLQAVVEGAIEHFEREAERHTPPEDLRLNAGYLTDKERRTLDDSVAEARAYRAAFEHLRSQMEGE